MLTEMRSRRRQRGAAMVEGVVVLPIFMILFVSVLYIRHQTAAKHEADMQARSCAWLYSANNCTARPPGCEGVNLGLGPNRLSVETDQISDNFTGGAASALAAQDADGVIGGVLGALVEPVVSAAFNKALESKVSKDVNKPSMFGGGVQTVSGNYRLACNLDEKRPADVARDAWNMVVP